MLKLKPLSLAFGTTRTLLRNLLSEPMGPTLWHAMNGTRDFRRISLAEQLEEYREPYKRSLNGKARVSELPGRWSYEVEFSDGDPHHVEIAKEAFSLYHGRCNCKGYTLGKDICSHLIRVAQEDLLDRVSVPRTTEPLHNNTCPTCGRAMGDGSL